jgi:uncharacterized protein (DUF2147 family)
MTIKSLAMRAVLLAIVSAGAAGVAAAQSDPAVGLWKNTEPDKTVLIRTYQENGKLFGKVEKVFRKGAEVTTEKCVKCQGDKKDQPVVGMVIIWDMQKDGSKWSGGKILEPDTGKVYACKIEAAPDGSKLSVRGSIAFLGKTETWTKAE